MIFRILVVACFALSVAQAQDIQYVFAENGLVVREKPNQGAVKVGLLDYGTAVEIIEHTNLSLDIKDNSGKITGQWVKIKGRTTDEFFEEGYVFNGYLTEREIHSPLKIKFDAFTVFVDELAKDSSLKNAELNDDTTPIFKIEQGVSPENRYLKVKHHQNYRTIEVFQRHRNSIVVTQGKENKLIDYQHYNSSWRPLKMLPSSGNIFKTITFSKKEYKRFGKINKQELNMFIKTQCCTDCNTLTSETKALKNIPYTIMPSQIQLKVVMTDIDGYKTEKIIIFELPLEG
ncbi:SH3 domain-containing protein [Ichthyenterobacterium sp. W332]|uniref:SH3 domain-containing protein n=1 Tax=Microcosmobacter mediterraneus TaxID=3075607 RepID=A0ABU2YJ50_9FLAO|nr:SH3 domain-containing protein [Ichthyenterobacterium sp. W332]MDT0558183.1 SH3 domain-containing protein [Ichthyenterobacterium sp. W332]